MARLKTAKPAPARLKDGQMPPWLTASEVAWLLNAAPKTVYALIHSGRLPARKLGLKSWLIHRDDFDALMSELPQVSGDRESA